MLVLSRDLGDPAALPAAVVAGGFAAIVALFALLVTETDEAFANVVLGGGLAAERRSARAAGSCSSSSSPASRPSVRSSSTSSSYQSFLLLLGSVFVPLFAVLLADWLAAGAHYSHADVFERAGLAPGARSPPGSRASRSTSGCTRPGPSWWVDLVGELNPPDWGIGATVPSFLVSFGIASVAAALAPRRDAAERRRVTRDRGRRATSRRDVVAGAQPRPGGGVFYAARALARLGADARVAARCSAERPADARSRRSRRSASRDVARVGDDDRVQLPLRGRPPDHVAGRRRRPVDAGAGGRRPRRTREWVNVCALTRTDFPPETLAALADGRTAAPRRRPGTRPHGDDRAARTPTRTSATCFATSRC